MTKELKITFILEMILSATIIAWASLLAFFQGVGIAFVAVIVCLGLISIQYFSNFYVKKRIKDLYITSCVFAGLEFFIYFFIEFRIGSYKFWEVLLGIQNVFSFFAIIFFAYIIFRYICEHKGVKFSFIEILLGNEQRVSKQKQPKEIKNGSLEEKPTQKETFNTEYDNATNNDEPENNVNEVNNKLPGQEEFDIDIEE